MGDPQCPVTLGLARVNGPTNSADGERRIMQNKATAKAPSTETGGSVVLIA